MKFGTQLLGIIRRIGLPLWMVVVLYNSLDQFLSAEMENGLRSPEGVSSLTWLYGVLSFFISLIFPVLLTLLILYGLSREMGSPRVWAEFLGKNLSQTLIETLRSWGRSLSWGLLFIIPGFYKFFLYTLVPFIVAFSKKYEIGHRDALLYSSYLVKKHWGQILGTVVVFHLLIPTLFSTYVDDYKIVWQTPWSALAVSLIDGLLWILGTQILFRITTKLFQEVADELTF